MVIPKRTLLSRIAQPYTNTDSTIHHLHQCMESYHDRSILHRHLGADAAVY